MSAGKAILILGLVGFTIYEPILLFAWIGFFTVWVFTR